jgi:hypothetical protein
VLPSHPYPLQVVMVGIGILLFEGITVVDHAAVSGHQSARLGQHLLEVAADFCGRLIGTVHREPLDL